MTISDLAYLEDISEGTTPTGGLNTYITYTVKRGDTLSDITEDYYKKGTARSCYNRVAKYNGISNANLIYPGQKLKLLDYFNECSSLKASVSEKRQLL